MLSHPQREALPGRGGVSHVLCLTEPLCFRYRVVVEGERGNRPHIYCLEQLLQEAVCEAEGCLSSVPMPCSGLGKASWKLCPSPATGTPWSCPHGHCGQSSPWCSCCSMAKFPHWQKALILYSSRDGPSCCPVSRQEAIPQQGNFPLPSPELLCSMPGVVGWSVLVPGWSVIAFLLP